MVSPTEPEILDLRGEVCPFTFVHAKLRLEELEPGARLVVLVDHEPASRNVPKSALEWGQRVREVREIRPGLYAIDVEKVTPRERGASAQHAPAPSAAAQQAGERRRVARAGLAAQGIVRRPGAPDLTTSTFNLSLVGAYLELADADRLSLAPGDAIELDLSAGGIEVRARAQVLRLGPGDHLRPPGAAVLFVDLAPDELTALHALIVHASRHPASRHKE